MCNKAQASFTRADVIDLVESVLSLAQVRPVGSAQGGGEDQDVSVESARGGDNLSRWCSRQPAINNELSAVYTLSNLFPGADSAHFSLATRHCSRCHRRNNKLPL